METNTISISNDNSAKSSGRRVLNIYNIGTESPSEKPKITELIQNEVIRPSELPKKPENAIRIVCLSDTHNKHDNINIPSGDILIHGGDFTSTGIKSEVTAFSQWLGKQKHKHKIVISGNHETTFEIEWYKKNGKRFHYNKLQDPVDTKSALTNCTYLEDQEVTVEGLKIYGSPWQPEFCNWAFNLNRGPEILAKWKLIPTNTDILVTHGPPKGHGGNTYDGIDAGCEDLLNEIESRIKPLVHIYGHIHEGYGVTTNGVTYFINASNCTLRYKPTNKAIVIDISK